MPRTTLIAWTFYTAFGTDDADNTIRLVTDSASGVHGAATVTWKAGESRPSVSHPALATGGRDDTFWGLLFGLSLFLPLLGAATFTRVGPPTHELVDMGISREFLNKIRDRVTPATCTVFAVAPHHVVERLMGEVAPFQPDEMILTATHFDQKFTVQDLFEDDATEPSVVHAQPVERVETLGRRDPV